MVSKSKKSLAIFLSVATLVATSLNAFATTTTVSGNSVSSDGGSTIVAEIASVPTTSSVAGVKTTVTGVYAAKSVTGVAVTAPLADLKALLGLAANESLYLTVYDITAKKNPASSAALDLIAASQNATVVTKLEMDFAKRSGNKLTMLPQGGAVPMLIGLKAGDFVPGATYAVIRVAPGGEASILPAVVNEKGVLAFEAVAGQAAYAIIRY